MDNILVKVLYVFIGIVLFKVIYNIYHFLLAKRYLTRYESYLENPADWYIAENRQKIVEILKKANIKDTLLPHVAPAGYGLVETSTFSVFENIADRREVVINVVYTMLREAKAVFQSRISESLNPFFWLDCLIYLPKIILNYIGVSSNVILVRILQIFWWVLSFAGIVIGILFNKEFTDWLLLHVSR